MRQAILALVLTSLMLGSGLGASLIAAQEDAAGTEVSTATETVPTAPDPAPVVTETQIPVETATETVVVTTPAESETPTTAPIVTATTEATTPPTAAPAGTPTAPPTTAPIASPTVAPTIEPTAVITWNQAEQVKCELRDGRIAGMKYAESRRYYCKVSTNVASDGSMPTDMKIEWTLDINFADTHVLEFPVNARTKIKKQEATGINTTRYTLTEPWTQEGGKQELVFELVLTRNTCAVGDQVLVLQAEPTIATEASKAEIRRQAGEVKPDPLKMYSPVINAEAPAIAFDGAISFESRSISSVGLDSDISRGAAVIVITGDWDPCTTWTVNLSGTVDVPIEAPAQLRAVSINNEPISGDACDLSAPCDLIVLPETGSAATPLRYTIGLELKLHELTPGGEFGIGLQAGVHGAGEQP